MLHMMKRIIRKLMQLFIEFVVIFIVNKLLPMKKLQIILLLCVAALLSCEKTDNLSSEYFPNSIGNYWVYSVTDNLNHKTYDVKISVEGDSLIDGIMYKKWKYSMPDNTDFYLVRASNDTVCWYFVNISSLSLSDMILTPWHRGDEWKIKGRTDTYEITGNTSVEAGGEKFSNVSKIIKKNNNPNDMGHTEYDMKPFLGLVKAVHYDYYLGIVAGDDVWELKEYSVKPVLY